LARSICTESDCGRFVQGHGLCSLHYGRKWQTSRKRVVCSIEGCGRNSAAYGLCGVHRRRQLFGTPMNAPIRQRAKGLTCSVEHCTRECASNGMCNAHWHRARRGADMHRPVGRNKGGWFVNSGGYRQLYKPEHPLAQTNGHVSEHRLVMEQMLGRCLLPHENVHHINGDRLDNRPENLELWSTSQPSGQRVEDKLAWARQLLSTYVGLDCEAVLRNECEAASGW
jgi:hypothetical protein